MTDTIALPTEWLAELCEWALGHGKTKLADEIADLIDGAVDGQA